MNKLRLLSLLSAASICAVSFSSTKIITNAEESDTTQAISEGKVAEVPITYSQDSTFSLSIPKTITIDKNTKGASFDFTLSGDLKGDEVVTVTPSSYQIEMTDSKGKDPVNIRVIYSDWASCYWTVAGNKTRNVMIDASGLTAGSWSGTLNFVIEKKLSTTGSDAILSKDMLSTYGIATTGDIRIPEYVIADSYKDGDRHKVIGIGDNAFSGCSTLTSIDLPDNVTSIGNAAFARCSALTHITIPDSVATIGNNAFNSCTSLAEITIPNNVTTLENMSFQGCSALTNVTVPDSVVSIGNAAFGNCSSLTDVTLSSNIKTIKGGAFNSCKNLKNITYKGATYAESGSLMTALEENGVTVENGAFYGTVFQK